MTLERTDTIAVAWSVVASAVLCVLTAASASAQTAFPSDSAIRASIQRAVHLSDGAGIVIGLLDANGDRRVLTVGNRSLDGSTLFEIGSITKVFTGILLSEMAERGEVRLDQPVAELLPPDVRMRIRGRPITLVDLSTHSSGLPRMPDNFQPADSRNPYADYTTARLHEFLRSHSPQRAPGERGEYSNLGVGLLGHALALRGDTSYEALLTARVLRPLNLTSTVITIPDSLRHRIAQGHDAQGRPVSNWDLDALAGAGALRSSASDMLTFLEANLAAPLHTTLGRALRRAQGPYFWNGERSAIGLGWGVQTTRFDRPLRGHGGSTAGYRAYIAFDPERRVGVVVLANQNVDATAIGRHLLDPREPLATPGLRSGFFWLAITLALLLIAGVIVAWRRTGASRRRAVLVALATASGLFLWLAATYFAAAIGFFRFEDPPTLQIVLVAVIVTSLGLGFSSFGQRLAAGLPLAVLVGVHGFRVPLELLLHRAYEHGLMPVQMTYSGLNLDIVTGLLAVVLALLLWRGKATRGMVRMWNLLGVLLLLNVVVIGLLSAPTPLRRFHNTPATTLVAAPPYIWLPCLMVAFAIFTHVVVWRHLAMNDASAPQRKHSP